MASMLQSEFVTVNYSWKIQTSADKNFVIDVIADDEYAHRAMTLKVLLLQLFFGWRQVDHLRTLLPNIDSRPTQ